MPEEEKEKEQEQEQEQEVQDPAEDEKSKKKTLSFDKRTVIVLIAILILMPVLAYFLVSFVINPALVDKNERLHSMISIGDTYRLDEIKINLFASKAMKNFIAKISFEMNRKELKFELNLRQEQFKDILIDIFRSKKFEEFSDPLIKNKLKREILDKFNAELETGEIVNIFFEKFFIENLENIVKNTVKG